MTRSDLEETLAATGRHLKAARALLRDDATPGVDGATLKGFDECLAMNEMELAMDELEDLGLGCHPVAEFWRHLMYAAESMQLTERAAEYQQRMQRT